jgi:hypothetical protein
MPCSRVLDFEHLDMSIRFSHSASAQDLDTASSRGSHLGALKCPINKASDTQLQAEAR